MNMRTNEMSNVGALKIAVAGKTALTVGDWIRLQPLIAATMYYSVCNRLMGRESYTEYMSVRRQTS